MLFLDSNGTAALHAAAMSDAVESPATDLLSRAKAGDTAAFRQLYAKHQRQVASQLAFLVPRADLEDTLQEVFIEVFRSLKRFEGRSAFTTWLYRVTVHVAMKARRKQTRSRLDIVEELPETADPAAGPVENYLSVERQRSVEVRAGPEARFSALHRVPRRGSVGRSGRRRAMSPSPTRSVRAVDRGCWSAAQCVSPVMACAVRHCRSRCQAFNGASIRCNTSTSTGASSARLPYVTKARLAISAGARRRSMRVK